LEYLLIFYQIDGRYVWPFGLFSPVWLFLPRIQTERNYQTITTTYNMATCCSRKRLRTVDRGLESSPGRYVLGLHCNAVVFTTQFVVLLVLLVQGRKMKAKLGSPQQ
jgi:hypothetical protein